MVNVGKYTIHLDPLGMQLPGSYGATTQGDSEMLRQLRKHRNWMPRNKRKARQKPTSPPNAGGYVVAKNTSSSSHNLLSLDVWMVCFWDLTTFSSGVWKPRGLGYLICL